VDPFPDLHHLSDEELDASLAALEQEETACSLQRRMLHGRIDLLRPVLVNRLRDELASGNIPGSPEGQPGRQLYDGHGLDAPDDELGPMPDVDAMTTDELRSTVRELERTEDDVSLRRRFLQGKVDILRAERARRQRGGPGVSAEDLGEILGGRA
jgi:hypothetical protein